MIKYFRFTTEQILWEISFINLMMFTATIPKFKTNKKPGEKKDGIKTEEDGTEVESAVELASFLNIK